MIYLDNAATSFPKPEPVYLALDKFARTSLANPGRSGHRMATGAERTLDEARLALNRFFNGEDPEALGLHPELHRRPEHRHQGDRLARRPRHHLRPGAQLRQPAAPGAGEGGGDHADAIGLGSGLHRSR